MLLYDAIDKTILKAIPNPSKEPYEIKIKVPEFTFLGVNEQPDFGVLYITIFPSKKIIELKSLKQYAYHLRNIVVSYERLINVVYNDLIEVYNPDRLRLVLKSNPRGGISSRLVIDSDWSARGGKEKYRDWGSTDDSWEITM
tara:strand:+ start:975 stop:1400 length:426 start_codon:yes stop_codon:yes gene_type:complete